MTTEFEKYKGIHPGAILGRLLKKKNISQRTFALSLPEHPQTFNAILKEKRALNTSLSLKIEKALQLEEGTLMTLQVYYDIKKENEKHPGESPNLEIIRKVLFWDTEFSKIDWQKYYKHIIQRVFERGDEAERQEIRRFYGPEKVNEALKDMPMDGDRIRVMPHQGPPDRKK